MPWLERLLLLAGADRMLLQTPLKKAPPFSLPPWRALLLGREHLLNCCGGGIVVDRAQEFEEPSSIASPSGPFHLVAPHKEPIVLPFGPPRHACNYERILPMPPVTVVAP